MKSIVLHTSMYLFLLINAMHPISDKTYVTKIQEKFALYAQSTASQKLKTDTKSEQMVTFAKEDIVINNICSFDESLHAFSVQKAGNYEITASISFNPFIYKPIVSIHKKDHVTILLMVKTSTDNFRTSKLVTVKKHSFVKGSLNVASTLLTVPITVSLEENEKIAVFVQQDSSSTLKINSESEAHIATALGMAVSKAIRILKK